MTAPSNNHFKQPVKPSMPSEQDATLAHMIATKRPLNLETYLAMEYPDGVPPMTAELWEEIPAQLKPMSSSSQIETTPKE